MTRAEVAMLLGLAAARDRRTVGETDVAAWHTDLGDLTFEEAREALNQHFRESTAWLMPAHLRDLVRVARSRKQPHHEALALPSRFEADDDRVARVKRGIAHCAQSLSLANDRRWAAETAVTGELSYSDQIRERAIERARRERRAGAA